MAFKRLFDDFDSNIFKTIDNIVDCSSENLEIMKTWTDIGGMGQIGICKHGLYRQYKWMCRAITDFNIVVCLLVWHLKKRGNSTGEIEKLLKLLEQCK